MKKHILLLFTLLFGFALLANALNDDVPNPMNPPRLVNDFAEVFTASERQQLESKLRAYHDSTSTQIYVVTVTTFNGDAAYNYAASLGNKWQIGQKGKDNGMLILIKPKSKDERGDVYIATGYGVEAYLTDAICGRIIDERMMPYLKQNNYGKAADEATTAVIQVLSGTFKSDGTAAQKPQSLADKILGSIFSILGIGLFIVLMIVSKTFRRIVFALILLGGRGGGGGKSGGGFGGGGGGRFGGGGAGRGW